MSGIGRIIRNWKKKPPKPDTPIPDTPPPPIIPDIPPVTEPPRRPGIPMLVATDVKDIGMSYWRNINQHAGQDILHLFLSKGGVLTVYTIDKRNLTVLNERPLNIIHTGEGAFFSRKWHNILYYGWEHDFYKLNIDTGEVETVWSSKHKLWQVHSDYEENRFSATLKNNDYKEVGWGVSDGREFPLEGAPDECQIDKSSEWLFIKEDNYNRIIHLPSGNSYLVQNEEGALGHGDIGFGMYFGENDMSAFGGALDCIRFEDRVHRMVNYTSIWNMGYFSFTNARPGDINQQWGLLTTPNDLIMVKLDNSLEKYVVCSHLTQSQAYEHRPKANLCPNGEFAAYTSFVSGSLNAYIVKV